MVALRRVKRLILFSVVAVSLLLFLQWRNISDLESFTPNKQGLVSLVWDVGEYNHSLVLDREREFDVNEILKQAYEDGAVNKKDWETAFNIKARHQVEKKSSFHNNDPGNNWSREEEDNGHDYEKRRLNSLQHENQTNVTTTQENKVSDRQNIAPTNSKGNTRANQRTTYVKPKLPTWKTFNWTSEMLGALNVHVWQSWCGSTIHDLRRNKFFPLYPDVRLTIKKFVIRHWEANYGQRVFGYIHPPVTGKYTFAISSDDTSELWLSTDASPLNVKLIAWVGNRTSLSGAFKTKLAQFTKYTTQLSKPVFLNQRKRYFVEALHKQASLEEHLLVGWKIPGLDNFRHISGKSISLFINERKAARDVTMYAQFIPQDLTSHTHLYRSSNIALDHRVFKFGSDDLRDVAHKDMFMDENLIRNLFPSCPYNPSYLVDFSLRRYEGVKLIHDTAVYPDDNSDLSHMRQYDKCAQRRLIDSYGNKLASLPPGLVSNQSLYKNGSIVVFLGGKGFLPLSLAKRALERQLTEEESQEMQLDVSDNRSVSQTPVGSHSNTVPKSYSLAKHDQEKAFEMKRKAKTKPTIGVKNEGQSKHRNNIYLMKAGRDREESVKDDTNGADGVPKYNRTTISDRSLYDLSRDQKPRVNHAEVSHKGVAATIVKRKLLSYDRGKRRTNEYDSRNQTNHNSVSGTSRVSRSKEGSYQSWRKTHGTDSSRKSPSKELFKPVDDQDDLMTRMNAAREYIRKMAGIVQKYDHKLNSRALADAVYKRFKIRMEIPNIERVPEYNVWLFHQNRTRCASDGNLLLNSEVATSVVNGYMRTLRRVTNGQHSLKEIVNVEENHDVMNGDRYLVELELNVKGKNSSVRLSQFVYKKIGSTEFCLPEGFVLNQHATVHIIIPVKNQGKWVQHFIDNMVELYQQTEDPHVNVILVDFSSTDINIVAALRRSPLKRYEVKKLEGPFQRAYGIHVGASLVQNPHDIIFMCDLHLQIPPNLIDSIRKHCVERKMAFAPIVARLHCGFSPLLPFGFWELQGYGLFAMYKSDYTRIGGMNYREFRTKWGGEDWELLDRVLLYKMEVERLRIPKFYHFYHSRKGMWGSRNTIFTSASDRIFGRYDDVDDIITLYDERKDKLDKENYARQRLQHGDKTTPKYDQHVTSLKDIGTR